jgi:hypothetical protein
VIVFLVEGIDKLPRYISVYCGGSGDDEETHARNEAKAMAEKMAKAHSEPMRLLKFTQAEHLETFVP